MDTLQRNHGVPSYQPYFPPPIRLRLRFTNYDSDSSTSSNSSAIFSSISSPSSETDSFSDISTTSDIMARQNKLGNFPKLQKYGWKVVKTLGDGNCLFRALAAQVQSRATNHKLVRGAIIREMRANANTYKPFMAFDPRRSSRLSGRRTYNSSDFTGPTEKDRNEMYEARLANMGKEGTWGDHLEIQAFCNSHNMNVVLFVELGALEPLVFSPMGVAGDSQKAAALPTAFLTFHTWQHYSSVGNASETEKMPATLAEFNALSAAGSREATPAASEAPSLTTAPSTPGSSASEPQAMPKLHPRSGKRARRIVEDDEDEEEEDKPKKVIKRIRLIIQEE